MERSVAVADAWIVEQTARAAVHAVLTEPTPPRLPVATLQAAARAVGANRHDAGLLFGARYLAVRLPDAIAVLEDLLGRALRDDVALTIKHARIIGPAGIPPATADLAFIPLDLAGPLRARAAGFFTGMIDPWPPGDFRSVIRPETARAARGFLADPPPTPVCTFPPFRVDSVDHGPLGNALARARAGRIFRLGREWFLLWICP